MSTSRALLSILLAAALFVGCGGPRPTPTPATGSSLHAHPALEARLPSQVDGHDMTKVSVAAVEERQEPKTLELLRRLGRAADDLQVAIATAADGTNIQVGAFRVVGADAVQIVVTFQAVEEADPESTATFGASIVAGRRLITRSHEAQLVYLYPVEDIMFVISGDTRLVETALGLLP